MTGWRASTWGDEVSLEYGKSLRDYAEGKGPFRVFGSNGPVGWTDEPLAPGPGVILGRKGAYRGVRFSAEPFYVIDTAYYVVPKTELDMRWLYYAIIHHKLGEIDDGSPIPSTTRSAVYVRDIDVPELPEQQAIAAVLSALDEKIELNRQMNETLEASARAVFRDWFIEFGPTRTKMAGMAPYLAPDIWQLFPGTLDDAGKPEGWIWSTIGKEVEAVGGSTPSTKDAALWDGDIAWTTPKDLSGLNSPVLMQTGRTISEAGLQTISSGLLPVGTVLMSSRAPVGYLAITQIPVAINQGYIAMRCNGRVSNWHAYLWAKENMDAIIQNANGSTFQEISKANFRPLPILVGDQGVRDRFDDVVQPMFEQIIANERESRTLAETRDLLLPKLMSGEIRVAQAEKLAGDSL